MNASLFLRADGVATRAKNSPKPGRCLRPTPRLVPSHSADWYAIVKCAFVRARVAVYSCDESDVIRQLASNCVAALLIAQSSRYESVAVCVCLARCPRVFRVCLARSSRSHCDGDVIRQLVCERGCVSRFGSCWPQRVITVARVSEATGAGTGGNRRVQCRHVASCLAAPQLTAPQRIATRNWDVPELWWGDEPRVREQHHPPVSEIVVRPSRAPADSEAKGRRCHPLNRNRLHAPVTTSRQLPFGR